MARRKGRIKDKWREKRWVNVNAPDSFNNVPIAYVPITDDENASGRVIEITLFDILKGDPSQHQYLSLIHISEPTRLRRISYAVFCLKKKKKNKTTNQTPQTRYNPAKYKKTHKQQHNQRQ